MFRNTFIAASSVLALSAVPAFAASHSAMDPSTMTCADFMALDGEGMMAAANAVDAAMQDSMAADSMAAEGAMEADSMEAEGAMEADSMAADSMEAEGAMEADSMAAEGAMEADPMMAEGMESETSQMLMEGCAGHDDMMVMDAMHAG